MASPVAERTNMDTSHAHRHADTCQPAQRHPLDSSLLLPTLAGTSSSGRRIRPRSSLLLFHGFPSQTHPGPHGHLRSGSPPSCLALLCGNQPELQTGPLGDVQCPFAHTEGVSQPQPSAVPPWRGPPGPGACRHWSTCSTPAVPTAASQPQRPAVIGGLPYFLYSPIFLCPGSPLVHAQCLLFPFP